MSKGSFCHQWPLKGRKTINGEKKKNVNFPQGPSLPDALPALSHLTPPITPRSRFQQVSCPWLCRWYIRRILRKTNPRKAAGIDNIPGRFLRECVLELTMVLTYIIYISLFQVLVPVCLRLSIVLVPKKVVSVFSHISSLWQWFSNIFCCGVWGKKIPPPRIEIWEYLIMNLYKTLSLVSN